MNTMVKDVMTADVVTVKNDTPYKEIATLFREHRVSAFPVVDDQDRVIGIVSEADLLSKEVLEDGTPAAFGGILRRKEQAKATGTVATDLMTRPVITIGPDEPVAHAARMMYARRLRRLPVVTGDGRLAGIVTRSDVLSVFSKPDEDIKREVSAMLDRFPVDRRQFAIAVKNGIVTLEGNVELKETGTELADAIRHTEGVVAVRDRLTYPALPRRTTGPLIWQ